MGFVDDWTPATHFATSTTARDFLRGLHDRGWIDGKNIKVHWKFSDGLYERRPSLIEELLRLPVDVLVVGGNKAVEDALKQTATTPIVSVGLTAPVEQRLVKSLSRPGGNLTGIALDVGGEVESLRLGLLKQIAPRTTRVAILAAWYETEPPRPDRKAAAANLGIDLFVQNYKSIDQIDAAVDELVRRGANAVFVENNQPLYQRDSMIRVVRAIERHRLPSIYLVPGASHLGGLMTYTDVRTTLIRDAALLVDRILKGANPAETPIQAPTKFELVLNQEAARKIGLAIPEALMLRADRVIQ